MFVQLRFLKDSNLYHNIKSIFLSRNALFTVVFTVFLLHYDSNEHREGEKIEETLVLLLTLPKQNREEETLTARNTATSFPITPKC